MEFSKQHFLSLAVAQSSIKMAGSQAVNRSASDL